MFKSVELIFDFVSPNAYLCWYPLQEICGFTRAEPPITPVFLGGMHRLTGNAPPFIRDKDVKGKNEYAMLEMRRFIAKHNLDRYRMNRNFPFNSIKLMRILTALEADGRQIEFIDAMLPAIWEQDLDVNDEEQVGVVIESAGFDASELFDRIQDKAIKTKLIDNTDEAVERGAFGIPTFYVHDGEGGSEMFFGKERLGQIDELLAG